MLTLYANFKGGTGKSTIVFNMAMWRIAQGEDVTVCDLDPQRTITDVASIREEDGIEPALTVVHSLPKGRKKGDWLVDVGTSDMDAMRAAIRAADMIVVPVTPSQADIWATQNFIDIVETERKKAKKKLPPMLAFVNRADWHPRSRENAETMEALEALGTFKALDEKLVQRLAFRRSFSEGLAVFELEPSSKAAAELDALARAIYG
ncbi:MAG TPA: ParA family protein [Rhodobacteraceae bacterium]|nr:ParA family protein [Paracoccaceae bacterium]